MAGGRFCYFPNLMKSELSQYTVDFAEAVRHGASAEECLVREEKIRQGLEQLPETAERADCLALLRRIDILSKRFAPSQNTFWLSLIALEISNLAQLIDVLGF